MRLLQAITVFIFLLAATQVSQAQISFTDESASLDISNTTSLMLMGVADMNNDGLDDIIRFHLNQGLNIEYQTGSGFINKTIDNLPNEQ